jgi:hypothetical protein
LKGIYPLIATCVSMVVRSVGKQESCCSLGLQSVERPLVIACFLEPGAPVSDINGLYRYIVQILRRTVEAVRENRTKPIMDESP